MRKKRYKPTVKYQDVSWFSKHWKLVLVGTVAIVGCGIGLLFHEFYLNKQKIENEYALFETIPSEYVLRTKTDVLSNDVHKVNQYEVKRNQMFEHKFMGNSFDICVTYVGDVTKEFANVIGKDSVFIRYQIIYHTDSPCRASTLATPVISAKDGNRFQSMHIKILQQDKWMNPDDVVYENGKTYDILAYADAECYTSDFFVSFSNNNMEPICFSVR